MKKIFITRKELKDNFKCISLGNADTSILPQAHFYWRGVYGWYCDVYIVDEYAITCGYNTIGVKPKNLESCLSKLKNEHYNARKGLIDWQAYHEYFYTEFIKYLKAGL